MVMVNGREGVVQWFCPCTALERVNTWIWYFELFTSTVQHVTNSITEAHVPTRDVQNSFEMGRDTASTCYLVGVMLMFTHLVLAKQLNWIHSIFSWVVGKLHYTHLLSICPSTIAELLNWVLSQLAMHITNEQYLISVVDTHNHLSSIHTTWPSTMYPSLIQFQKCSQSTKFILTNHIPI